MEFTLKLNFVRDRVSIVNFLQFPIIKLVWNMHNNTNSISVTAEAIWDGGANVNFTPRTLPDPYLVMSVHINFTYMRVSLRLIILFTCANFFVFLTLPCINKYNAHNKINKTRMKITLATTTTYIVFHVSVSSCMYYTLS